MQIWLVHLLVASVVMTYVCVPSVSAILILMLKRHTRGVVVGAEVTGLTTEILVVSGRPNGLTITKLHRII